MAGKTFRPTGNAAVDYVLRGNYPQYEARTDCLFYRAQGYRKPDCAALKELYCRKEKCSFYKPREGSDADYQTIGRIK